jgi:hypothetical protein
MLLAIPRKLTNVLSALCVGTILALWQAHAYAQASAQKDIQPAALVAAWKLTAAYTDKNRNGQLDDNERQDPLAGMQDYLKLNADGSCEFYVLKVRGRYEVQPRSDGTKKLILFDKDNHKEDRGLIYSVSKTELILLNLSTRVFTVYTRQ